MLCGVTEVFQEELNTGRVLDFGLTSARLSGDVHKRHNVCRCMVLVAIVCSRAECCVVLRCKVKLQLSR